MVFCCVSFVVGMAFCVVFGVGLNGDASGFNFGGCLLVREVCIFCNRALAVF